jgi:hypothetical protein
MANIPLFIASLCFFMMAWILGLVGFIQMIKLRVLLYKISGINDSKSVLANWIWVFKNAKAFQIPIRKLYENNLGTYPDLEQKWSNIQMLKRLTISLMILFVILLIVSLATG